MRIPHVIRWLKAAVAREAAGLGLRALKNVRSSLMLTDGPVSGHVEDQKTHTQRNAISAVG